MFILVCVYVDGGYIIYQKQMRMVQYFSLKYSALALQKTFNFVLKKDKTALVIVA